MMENFLNKKLVFNPIYKIKLDEKRLLIINANEDSLSPQITHPIFGALFSFFKGDKTCDIVLDEACNFFNSSRTKMESLIKGFVENSKDVMVKYDDILFRFPPMVLVENVNDVCSRNDLDAEKMLLSPPYDFDSRRLYMPLDILFVINTKCVTDCVYCYADKKTPYVSMPTERILEVIEQAHNMGVRSFELSGGEVFLHKDWKVIVKKLVDCGYSDFISTKIPMTKEQVDDFVETGMKTIQVSLDSLNPTLLSQNLNVDESYCQKMKDSLRYIDTKDLEIIIKGTHTRHTATVENVKGIVDFISTLRHLKKYTVSTIGASMYKTNESFHDLKPSCQELKALYDYLETVSTIIKIQPDYQDTLRDELCNYKKFKDRTLCTGNVSGLVILPDGKVTICEELYWNDNFIIGDLMKDDLLAVWQSEKALSLWNIKQEVFPKESSCSSCQEFIDCRRGLGVCWKYVIGVYGKQNHLFPDPRCPKAPAVINDVFYD